MERKNERLPIFTERFRELQGDRSNTEFAEFLGISRQTVGFYYNGDRVPDAITLAKIAKKCKISADWLLGLSNVRTTDIELKQVCEYTGLSKDAIQNIVGLTSEQSDIVNMQTTLNVLLESGSFETGVREMQKLLSATKQNVIDQASESYFDSLLDDDEEDNLIKQIERKVGKPVRLLIGYDKIAERHMELAKYCFKYMVEFEAALFEREISDSIKGKPIGSMSMEEQRQIFYDMIEDTVNSRE